MNDQNINKQENIIFNKPNKEKNNESLIELSNPNNNFNELENIISIEDEINKTNFNHIVLDFKQEVAPDYDLGIEITIAKLQKPNIENIDPQHAQNPNIDSSAIEEALSYDLSKLPQNATIATLRPDADSVGAMAVLELRKSQINPDENLVKAIGRFDSLGFKKAKELYPEVAVRQFEITAASQKCLSKDNILDKVKWMKNLLTNRVDWQEIKKINTDWESQKDIAKRNLQIEPLVEQKAVLVTGNHPQAFAIGYEEAGIVAAYNPKFSRPWIKDDSETEKWTIARYSEKENINIEQLKKTLNAMEKTFTGENHDPKNTWGGPKNLVASPQGYTSAIPKEKIIEAIKSAISENDRKCTCGSGLSWSECQGIDGNMGYCG